MSPKPEHLNKPLHAAYRPLRHATLISFGPRDELLPDGMSIFAVQYSTFPHSPSHLIHSPGFRLKLSPLPACSTLDQCKELGELLPLFDPTLHLSQASLTNACAIEWLNSVRNKAELWQGMGLGHPPRYRPGSLHKRVIFDLSCDLSLNHTKAENLEKTVSRAIERPPNMGRSAFWIASPSQR